MQKSRTPFPLGWEAARANAVPALIIQVFMLALLIAYYTNHGVSSALTGLAHRRVHHGRRAHARVIFDTFFSAGSPNAT